MKVSEVNLTNKSFLFWGPAGTGKSVFAGTLGPYLHMLNFDGNIDGLRTTQDQFTPWRSQVEVELGLNRDDYAEGGFVREWGLSKIKRYLLAIHDWCNKGTYPFKAVCMDPLTELSEASKRWVLANIIRPKNEHKLTPDIGQWGMMFTEIQSVIELFVSIPRMKILIAHEQMNEVDNVLSQEIMIPGKQLPGIIRTKFSEIWYFQNNAIQLRDGTKSNYVIRTVRSLNATARSCLNIPDNTPQNLGMIEILNRFADVDITGASNVASTRTESVPEPGPTSAGPATS